MLTCVIVFRLLNIHYPVASGILANYPNENNWSDLQGLRSNIFICAEVIFNSVRQAATLCLSYVNSGSD